MRPRRTVRKRELLIGAIASIAILAIGLSGLAAVLIYATDRNYDRYTLRFRGDLSGLSQGSPVTFNGIRVGTVSDIDFDASNPAAILIRVAVTEPSPIKSDTKVIVETSLAGTSTLQFRGGSQAAALVPPNDGGHIIEASGPQAVGLVASVRSGLDQTLSGLQAVQGALDRNRVVAAQSIRAFEDATETLRASADQIGTAKRGVIQFGRLASQVSDGVSSAERRLKTTLRDLDPNKVRDYVDTAREYSASLADAGPDIVVAGRQATEFLARRGDISQVIDSELATVQATLSEVSADRVRTTVDGLAAFVQRSSPQGVADALMALQTSADQLAAGLSLDPDILRRGIDRAADIGAAIDGPAIQQRLARLERTIAAIDGDDVRSSVASIEAFTATLAQTGATLDRRMAAFSDGLQGGLARIDGLDRSIRAGRENIASADLGAVLASNRAARDFIERFGRGVGSFADDVASFSDTGSRSVRDFANTGRASFRDWDRAFDEFRRGAGQILDSGSDAAPPFRQGR